MPRTKMTTLAINFLSYFPMIVSDAISCPLRNLNTLWYIILIFYSYVEHVIPICRVQERHLSFAQSLIIMHHGNVNIKHTRNLTLF